MKNYRNKSLCTEAKYVHVHEVIKKAIIHELGAGKILLVKITLQSYGRLRIRRFIENWKSFMRVINDFLSSDKIDEAHSAQGATLCPRFTNNILVL